MIGQIKGKVEQKGRERTQRRRKKKKSRAEAHGLDNAKVLGVSWMGKMVV